VNTIAKDDWIRVPTLWPGIWRVFRTFTGFKEDRWSLDEPVKQSNRTIVFCHRIVNDSWKRSFFHRSCEVSLVHPLSSVDREKIETLTSSNLKLIAAFEKYRASTKPIDLIANLGFGNLSEQEAKGFRHLCDGILADRIQGGLTMDDVLTLLRESGLDLHRHKFPQQRTLQLISIDHELRGDRFVYRRYGTLLF
jgi:hypothetical protein